MQSNLVIWYFAMGHLSTVCGRVFLGTAIYLLRCTNPGYVGQLGWAVECPTYPVSTAFRKKEEVP